ncbi:CDP-alcohol phosphatidyltransferase family protein [Gemmobacter serpentinus]|uniref:CDP-alcohol phosphatidyltransferase family protein n=1 Tax=Gemmobacter serpentinus TaxID=2652247 RepID=UPI00124F2FD7|nr:phosphatidylcholine/phosphatidylserine synthase [Gemmobacter serpentinus]
MQAPRPRRMSILGLLPNMLTVGALCAGVTAIRFAIEGRFAAALILIFLAAIMDGLDGRLARLLRSESQIGAELDSLCDFVNFGVAPGLIVWLWALQDMRAAGWIAVLIYVVSCLLRLARFNIGHRAIDSTAEKTGFQGVPSPAGALLCFLPMFAAFATGAEPLHGGLVAIWMALVGAMMIGRFQTPSFKKLTFEAQYVRYVVVAFAALLAALLAYPWATLVAMDLIYLCIIAVSLVRRAPKSQKDPKDGA